MELAPLIVGAGPTGLSAALFLAEGGVQSRIIDKAPAPSINSRAQVINPRSLELLQQELSRPMCWSSNRRNSSGHQSQDRRIRSRACDRLGHFSDFTSIRPVRRMNPPFAGVTAVYALHEVRSSTCTIRASDVFLP